MDIVDEQTSPYNPQANGHAEEAIGKMKRLITKAGTNDFKSAMLSTIFDRKCDTKSKNREIQKKNFGTFFNV